MDKDLAFVRWYDRPPVGDAGRRCQRTNLERCKVVQEVRNRYGIVELASIRGAVHITPDYRCQADGFYLVNTFVDTLSHKQVRLAHSLFIFVHSLTFLVSLTNLSTRLKTRKKMMATMTTIDTTFRCTTRRGRWTCCVLTPAAPVVSLAPPPDRTTVSAVALAPPALLPYCPSCGPRSTVVSLAPPPLQHYCHSCHLGPAGPSSLLPYCPSCPRCLLGPAGPLPQ